MGLRVKGLGMILAAAICIGLGDIQAAAAETPSAAGEKGSRTLRYEIADQLLESGKRLCDLDCPAYALTEDGTQVSGTLVWYFTGSGYTLDENMEVVGEAGEQFVFGWRFLPSEPYREYGPITGEIVVTLRAATRGEKSSAGQTSDGTESETDINGAASNPAGIGGADEGGNGAGSDEDEQSGEEAQISAVSEAADEETTQQKNVRPKASGQVFGAATVTVVPEGTDPSLLMGSETTGIGALSKTGQTGHAGNSGSDETEKTSEISDGQAAESDESMSKTGGKTNNTEGETVETDEKASGVAGKMTETDEETAGTDGETAEAAEDDAESEKILAKTEEGAIERGTDTAGARGGTADMGYRKAADSDGTESAETVRSAVETGSAEDARPDSGTESTEAARSGSETGSTGAARIESETGSAKAFRISWVTALKNQTIPMKIWILAGMNFLLALAMI